MPVQIKAPEQSRRADSIGPPSSLPRPRRGMGRDAAWQFAERGVRLGLGFALSLLMARNLGPTDFGIYTFSVSLVALFAFLGQAGLEAILVRQLVNQRASTSETLSTSLILRLAGACLGAAAATSLAALSVTEELTRAPYLVMILSIAGLMQAGWVIEPWLQVNDEFKRAALAKIGAYVLAAILRIASLMSSDPLFYLAVASAAESALCTVLLWLAAIRRPGGGPGKLRLPKAEHLRLMTALVTPMILSAMTVAIYSRIDVFMLGVMSGPDVAGMYGAATLISEGFYLIPAAVMTAASPRLARLYVANRDGFSLALSRLVAYFSGSGLAVVFMTLIFGPLMISLFFGNEYQEAGGILSIHIWSTWMVFVSTACDSWYVNNDFRKHYLGKTAFAALLNILLNFILIPKWQGEGAALATVLSYGFSAVGYNVLFKRTRPLFRLQLAAMLLPWRKPPYSNLESIP